MDHKKSFLSQLERAIGEKREKERRASIFFLWIKKGGKQKPRKQKKGVVCLTQEEH